MNEVASIKEFVKDCKQIVITITNAVLVTESVIKVSHPYHGLIDAWASSLA
jgi:hypothetical protein